MALNKDSLKTCGFCANIEHNRGGTSPSMPSPAWLSFNNLKSNITFEDGI
jgi:hypothetical protein